MFDIIYIVLFNIESTWVEIMAKNCCLALIGFFGVTMGFTIYHLPPDVPIAITALLVPATALLIILFVLTLILPSEDFLLIPPERKGKR